MSIFSKLSGNIAGLENEVIPYEQMVGMVRENFIKGADDDFLKKVKKTAKGDTFTDGMRLLDSKDERFRLIVQPVFRSFMVWIMGKDVSFVDRQEGKHYMIRSRQWKKFYKFVLRVIEEEKLNRTR